MQKFTQEERDRERYQARLKWERDQTAFIDEAREEGYKKGFEQGFWMGRIFSRQEKLGMPLTPQEELIAMTIDELRAKAADLQQKLDAVRND